MDYCPFKKCPCPHPKSISVSQETDGSSETFDVCQLCLMQMDNPIISPNLSKIIDLIDISNQKSSVSCPGCGIDFGGIMKIKRYGCDKCYDTFRGQSLTIFDKYQFGAAHVGKMPRKCEKEFLIRDASIQLALLVKQLAVAIDGERYEDATLIRDKIRKIREANENHEV